MEKVLIEASWLGQLLLHLTLQTGTREVCHHCEDKQVEAWSSRSPCPGHRATRWWHSSSGQAFCFSSSGLCSVWQRWTWTNFLASSLWRSMLCQIAVRGSDMHCDALTPTYPTTPPLPPPPLQDGGRCLCRNLTECVWVKPEVAWALSYLCLLPASCPMHSRGPWFPRSSSRRWHEERRNRIS